MATIQQVRGFEILDSRGNPTVAAEVVLDRRCAGLRGVAVRRFDRGARSDRAARRRPASATSAKG